MRTKRMVSAEKKALERIKNQAIDLYNKVHSHEGKDYSYAESVLNKFDEILKEIDLQEVFYQRELEKIEAKEKSIKQKNKKKKVLNKDKSPGMAVVISLQDYKKAL